MALETERSEQQQLSNGLAGLKGFANDIWAATAGGTRRLADASAARASGTAQSVKSAARTSRRRGAYGCLAHGRRGAPHGQRHRAWRAERGGARRADGRRAPKALAPIQAWLSRQPIVRFFSASLLRRILISNLIGFVILVGGILYLGWFHTWLIDAKLEP